MKTQEINQPAELNVPALIGLAEDLESGRYKEHIGHFNMASWSHCIAGLCCRKHGFTDWTEAREFLGISLDQSGIFGGPYASHPPTPKQAAQVIRHLAQTGEVDWVRAREPWYKFW